MPGCTVGLEPRNNLSGAPPLVDRGRSTEMGGKFLEDFVANSSNI